MSNIGINSDLVMYDIENFLDKYTRFMTKDIYITKDMYSNFLKYYDYLYKKLEKDAILYRENIKYKKIMEIKDNSNSLLKLHNQKYLKKNLSDYDTFFNNINSDEQLDLNQKYVVISKESKSLLINNKNTDLLITTKVKYISEFLKVKNDKILVLIDDDSKLKKMFLENNLDSIDIINIKEYKKQLIGKNKLITSDYKFKILNDYITNYLFKDKDNFNKLYNAFSNHIYLNKDYKEYDTFLEYHNYMYKKKFLSSKLSLDRFVEKEIEKRKVYLRTIKNELLNTKEEVILGNYLCCNNIEYYYDKDNKLFNITDSNKLFNIKIIYGDNISDKHKYNENIIYINENLITNNLYKEILEDEFCIRRIKKYKVDINDIYTILKDTISDNYFNEFINKYLIKYLDYYDKNNNYDNTKLNTEQKDILINIYNYYKKNLVNNGYVTNIDVNRLLEEDINKKKYKYIIVYSKEDFNFSDNVLLIKDDYNNIELIKENIKLLYDYKKYLQENKCLVAQNLYTNNEEIDELTNSFLNNNLNIINDFFSDNKKNISVYLYDDSNRLKINKNISKMCYEIIRKNDDILIGINSYNNINSLINKDYLVKVSKNKLEVFNKIVDCEEILKVKKSYNKVILPFLIVDSYHENLISSDDDYNLKLMIYTSLSKCKNELILLCPNDKKKYIVKLLKRINNLSIYE